MRKIETFAVLCVLLYVCVVGIAARKRRTRCSGKHGNTKNMYFLNNFGRTTRMKALVYDCLESGQVPGVRYRLKRRNGYIRRNYFCDWDKTLNINRKEVFECCYDSYYAMYTWRSKRKVNFKVHVDGNLKCEEKVPCSQPPEPAANMSRDVVTRYMDTVLGGSRFYDGDIIQYTCPEGFEHVPEDATQKQASEETDYAYYAYYDYLSHYYNTGDSPDVNLTAMLTCSPGGRWVDNTTQSGDFQLGQCREILCDASRFENITHGRIVNYTSVYQYGKYLELQCDEGYRPRDHVHSIKCETPESFALENVQCQEILCPSPPLIANGGTYYSSRAVNGTVTFDCYHGYTLSGQKTWRCQENGEWDSSCIVCNRKDTYCSAPCVPEGAILLNPQDTYPEGAVVNLTCEKGFMYGGSPERVCLRNRQWSGDLIDCQGRRSRRAEARRLVTALENATLPSKDTWPMYGSDYYTDYEEVNVMGKSINVNQPGGVDVTLLVDVSGSITDAEFETTKRFINALLPRLHISDGQSGTRLVLKMFATDVYEVHDDHYVDVSGEKPLSNDEWLDLIQGLRRDEVQRRTKKSTALGKALKSVKLMLHTKQVAWAQHAIRIAQQVLIVVSDGLFNMGDHPLPIAEQLKDEYGLEVYAICLHSERKGSLGVTLMKDIASEEEYHFFLVNRGIDVYDMEDFINMMINEIGPGCTECGCTLPWKTKYRSSENRHHTEAIRNAWPWMVQLKQKNNMHLGAGSIISNQWILTSAHLFGTRDIDPFSVVAIDLKRHDREDDNGVDTVHIRNHQANVILHEKFDTTKAPRFLYDIALIHLEKDQSLHFNSDLHAVCLGNQADPAYFNYLKEGAYGVVTGWGATSDSHNGYTKILKQMQMSIQSNNTCLNMVKKRETSSFYNEELMFCAGGKDEDGKVIDVCRGDSGDPFVVPYDDPMKSNHFLQIGIVSSGVGGCMMDGVYSIYTKLTPELLRWIEDTIQRVESQE